MTEATETMPNNNKVITLASLQGGTGRTTTAVALAVGLAKEGKRVLLIDIDTQGFSTIILLPDARSLPEDKTIVVTMKENKPLAVHTTEITKLFITPSHQNLHLAYDPSYHFDPAPEPKLRLSRGVDALKQDYDYIIIDAPPGKDWLSYNALIAADRIVVPYRYDYTATASLLQMYDFIEEVKEHYNPTVQTSFLHTMSNGTSSASKKLSQNVHAQFLKTSIPFETNDEGSITTLVAAAHQDIFTYRPDSKTARAYQELIQELFTSPDPLTETSSGFKHTLSIG